MPDDNTMATIITTVMCVRNDDHPPAVVDQYWQQAMKWIGDYRYKQATLKPPQDR